MTTAAESAKEPKISASNGDADGFVEIQVDRPSLKFENETKREGNEEIYTGAPYEGYLAGFASFGEVVDEETGELRAQSAYIFILTKAGKAYDREGKIVPRKVGDEVLLWPNVRLEQAIEVATGIKPQEAAQHPTHMLHMRITPIKRAPFKSRDGKTQRMWQIKVAAKPNPVARAGKVAIGVLAGVNMSAPALPQN